MSWNNDQGPWGGTPSGKKSDAGSGEGGGNPWLRKSAPDSGGPKGNTPPPGRNEPPFDVDTVFRTLDEKFRRWQSHSGGPAQLFLIGLVLLIGVWLLSGLYQVGASQAGVVMRFGAFDRIETSGLHYHAPYPFEDALLPNVTSQNKIEIGFRSVNDGENARTLAEESMMLTQDENFINVQFTVFWRVGDVQKFLFEIRDPETTIKMAAESAMREVIGQNRLQFALTDGRSQIADETLAHLQKLLDSYNSGVIISQINLQTVAVPDEVTAAFQDVVNARLDQERFRNEAMTHANEVVPKAKGDSAKITQQALAYRDQKIAVAKGDADRFKEVLAAYAASRDVTAKRLYLETMEAVLGNARKIIIDKAGSGAVPYLPLPDMLRAKPAASEGDVK